MTPEHALTEACARTGIDSCGAQTIRHGENLVVRLPGPRLVARVGRPGRVETARREIHAARWLATHDVPVTWPADLNQPVTTADGRPVTFWHDLGEHRRATLSELAAALRMLHRLPPPTTITLPALDPTALIRRRLIAGELTSTDRAWLLNRATLLGHDYRQLPPGLPRAVIHGDASTTNLAVTPDGTVYLIDLERLSIGPPEWDLTSTAIEQDYRWITPAEYAVFATTYGHDVTLWTGYHTLRALRELRMVAWIAQLAAENPEHRAEARHRLDCLRGDHGHRPWTWQPL